MNSAGDTLYATGMGGTHIVPLTPNPSLNNTGYENAILPRPPLKPVEGPKVVTTTTTTNNRPTLVNGANNKFLIS
jgi:hypothetical protein